MRNFENNPRTPRNLPLSFYGQPIKRRRSRLPAIAALIVVICIMAGGYLLASR